MRACHACMRACTARACFMAGLRRAQAPAACSCQRAHTHALAGAPRRCCSCPWQPCPPWSGRSCSARCSACCCRCTWPAAAPPPRPCCAACGPAPPASWWRRWWSTWRRTRATWRACWTSAWTCRCVRVCVGGGGAGGMRARAWPRTVHAGAAARHAPVLLRWGPPVRAAALQLAAARASNPPPAPGPGSLRAPPPPAPVPRAQALGGVLSASPYAFSLELAALAGSRGALDLEAWAAELMTQDAVHFVTALLAFMDAHTAVRRPRAPRCREGRAGVAPAGSPHRAHGAAGPSGVVQQPALLPLTPCPCACTQADQPPGQVQLAESSVRALLRALQPMRGQVPGDVGQLLKKVQEQVARLYPALTPLVSVSGWRGVAVAGAGTGQRPCSAPQRRPSSGHVLGLAPLCCMRCWHGHTGGAMLCRAAGQRPVCERRGGGGQPALPEDLQRAGAH